MTGRKSAKRDTAKGGQAIIGLLPEAWRQPTVARTIAGISIGFVSLVLGTMLVVFVQGFAAGIQTGVAGLGEQPFDPDSPFTADAREVNTTGQDFAYPYAVDDPAVEESIVAGNDVTGAVPIDGLLSEFMVATTSDQQFLITDIRIEDRRTEVVVTGTLVDKTSGTGGPGPRKTLYFDLETGVASDKAGGPDYFVEDENVLVFDSASRLILGLRVPGPVDGSWSWVYRVEVADPDGEQLTYYLDSSGRLHEDPAEINPELRFRITTKAAPADYDVIFAEDDTGQLIRVKG